MRLVGYVGFDQYGQHYKITKYPRKELLEELGRKHASNMYIDLKDGGHRHIGYVIAGHWIEVYRVYQWKDK